MTTLYVSLDLLATLGARKGIAPTTIGGWAFVLDGDAVWWARLPMVPATAEGVAA